MDAGRPWMLGTDDNPPPLRVPWQMWSRSSDPHQQGLIAFEFTEEGLAVGWYPDGFLEKDVISWDELAWMSGNQSLDLKREVEFIKEQAETEGLKLGRQKAVEEISGKVAQFESIANETSNPFLLKYAESLKTAITEIKELLR